LPIQGINRLKRWKESVQLNFNPIDGVAAMPRVQPPRFAAPGDSFRTETELEMFNPCRRATADRQGNCFGEGESTQAPNHADSAPILKLTQPRRDRHCLKHFIAGPRTADSLGRFRFTHFHR
jgi:hypothetical protein